MVASGLLAAATLLVLVVFLYVPSRLHVTAAVAADVSSDAAS
jgi:hypothetical protein